MADDGNEQQPNWWGSWINTAKTKSASMLEAVKKDLDEISTAVKTEATNLAESLKFDEPDSTAGAVKKSLSTFFGQVTEALVPSMEDDDAEAILITSDGSVTLTGFQKHLAELQKNEDTYLQEPFDVLQGQYKRWLEVVEQDQFTQPRLAKHLTSSTILNEKYIHLVPEKVAHMEFWKRYLFKKALLEDALANAEMVERKAKSEINSTATVSPAKTIIQTQQPMKVIDDDDLKAVEAIDEEEMLKKDLKLMNEDFIANVELSEEEQARLLAEYELEIQEREKSKMPDLEQELSRATGSTKKGSSTAANKKPNQNKQTPSSSSAQPTSKAQNLKSDPKQKLKNNKQNSSSNNISNNNKKVTPDKELKVEKNHFKKDNDKDENLSSNSDESWEKEFDELNDPEAK